MREQGTILAVQKKTMKRCAQREKEWVEDCKGREWNKMKNLNQFQSTLEENQESRVEKAILEMDELKTKLETKMKNQGWW